MLRTFRQNPLRYLLIIKSFSKIKFKKKNNLKLLSLREIIIKHGVWSYGNSTCEDIHKITNTFNLIFFACVICKVK